MLDNLDVAILTKLNDLAERRGIKPYDFVATLHWDEEEKIHVIRFDVPAAGDRLKEERFEKMLLDLGIVADDRAALKGSAANVVDALDHALSLSPKPRSRF
jgi:hypothetical protein